MNNQPTISFNVNSGIVRLTGSIPNDGINVYEQAMARQQIIWQQRREFQQALLEQNYPVNYIIGHSVLIGMVSVALIAIQIVMIVNQYTNYYLGSGIWVSAYLLIAMSVALSVSKCVN